MGPHPQTAAAMACMKSLLLVFNAVFWVSGLALLAIGGWMEMELYKYVELSPEFSGTATYVLIGTGALIVAIGTLACCCTLKGQPVLLYVYGAFLAIVFVLELGAGISIFANKHTLIEGFDKGLSLAIANYRNETYQVDFLQRTLHCCGNHDSNDWLGLSPPLPVPLSCCIEDNCNTEDERQIYTQGCYFGVVDVLNKHIALVAGGAVGIAFFPLVGLFLSCCLASFIVKVKYEQMT